MDTKARQINLDISATKFQTSSILQAVCRAYWQPLYAYVRRCGQSPHDAQDLTQEFFCRLLEKRWLDAAAREKGKLRTFLIAMKQYRRWRGSPNACI